MSGDGPDFSNSGAELRVELSFKLLLRLHLFESSEDLQGAPPVNSDSVGENSFISTRRLLSSGSVPLASCLLLENA
jgi:hypothetical protein